MMVPRAGTVAILTELNPLPPTLPFSPPTPTPRCLLTSLEDTDSMMVPRAGIVAILTELNPLPPTLPSCPPTPNPWILLTSLEDIDYDGAKGWYCA